jgi:hypothetical protein
MTEAEWLACADPTPMLEFCQSQASNRQLQLFGCACCRRLLGLFPNASIRQAVDFAERDADELAGPEMWLQAEQAASSWLDARTTMHGGNEHTRAEASAVRTACGLLHRHPMGRASLAKYTARDAARAVHTATNDRRAIREAAPGDVVRVARAIWQAAEAAWAAERQAQAALLRDILGNPFHPAALDPE